MSRQLSLDALEENARAGHYEDSKTILELIAELRKAQSTIEQVRAWRRSKDLRGQLPDSAHEELIAILAAHTKEKS